MSLLDIKSTQFFHSITNEGDKLDRFNFTMLFESLLLTPYEYEKFM